MEYTISKHCQERYAERIMDKEDKTDIASFIAVRIDKINEDINKMIEYGEKIFEGKSTNGDYNKNTVQIYIKDCWVIIVDPSKNNVITLFKVDLGLGDEFNKSYVEKLMLKLKGYRDKYSETCSEIDRRNTEFRNLIEENNQSIKEYQKLINSLKEQNESYQTLIQESETNKKMAETGIREVIGTLTSKKIF